MEATLNTLPYTLRAIYLRESHTRVVDGFDPTVANQLVGQFRILGGEAECRNLEVNTQNGTPQVLRTCVFSTRFEFQYLLHREPNANTEEPVIAAEISALITVDYQCNKPEFPAEAELHKWGKSNVLLHAWPYWREYCHSTMARMQLPVILIPLANFVTKEPDVVEPVATKAARKRAKRS